ncbi:MAG TPA: VOC family protein [Blastocatellia bacterium]|nr:VOC family protein [Blastocatellia bacterium]
MMPRLLCLLTTLLLTLTASWPNRSARTQEKPLASPLFHHLHLNSTAPEAAIQFYTRTFDVTKRTQLAGWQAVQSENSFLLFNKVSQVLALAPDNAIWHFGWGSTAMEADYERHKANGIEFATPLTRLNASLQFAYMKAPDGALVEINTAATRAFLHTHLYSAAPLCAADWYVKHLGAISRSQRTGSCEVPFAAPSEPLGVIRSPATTVRFGDVSLIIYPQQRPTKLVSPRGHTVDHIALSVTDLTETLARLKKEGVTVLEELHPFGNSKTRAAMIEGPDAIAIELIETK